MSTSAFYSASDAEVMLKHAAENTESEKLASVADFESEFNIKATADWINCYKFKRVALQFPDELLHCSVPITCSLQSQCTDSLCVILADTKYGSCCVDEVAAQHYHVEAIVHYGHACLSPVARLPVYYVYGRSRIDIRDSCEQIKSLVTSEQHIILIYDVIYHHAIEELSEKLASPNLIVSSLVVPTNKTIESSRAVEQPSCTKESGCCAASVQTSDKCCKEGVASLATADNPSSERTVSICSSNSQTLEGKSLSSTEDSDSAKNLLSFTSKIKVNRLNREFYLPEDVDLEGCVILYIGPDGLFQTALMMTFNRCQFITYDPVDRKLTSDAWNMNRKLMKRYYMVERARDAARVGILVGTLGVRDYLQVIRKLSDLIRRSGKKCYRFAVGKLNEAKLANFAEIDVFVLIACPENSLIDSSDMFRPVVTPFEMELACQPNIQWTGSYEVDFRQLLPGGNSYHEPVGVEGGGDSLVMDVSLVTGRVRQIGLDSDESSAVRDNSCGTLVQQDGRIMVHNSAGEYLQGRSWQGLDPKLGETAVSDVVQGRTGIAAGYQQEPK